MASASQLPITSSPASPAPGEVTPEWVDPHLATVFSRWHAHLVAFEADTTDAIIDAAAVRPGAAVLDVGCGSGIPTLALADRVRPTGRVTATDPSPVFVAAVTENARQAGLTNVDAVRVSAAGLPFPPASFDAATCHMGAMFFPDLQAGLTRIRAVLKAAGRAAFVAWGPESDTAYFSTFWSTVNRYLPPADPPSPDPPPPDPDQPRPSRFAAAGSLSFALLAAGFKDVREEAPMVTLVWPDDVTSVVQFWLELSRVEDRVPDAQHQALRTELVRAYHPFEQDGYLHFPARVVVASGRAA